MIFQPGSGCNGLEVLKEGVASAGLADVVVSAENQSGLHLLLLEPRVAAVSRRLFGRGVELGCKFLAIQESLQMQESKMVC